VAPAAPAAYSAQYGYGAQADHAAYPYSDPSMRTPAGTASRSGYSGGSSGAVSGSGYWPSVAPSGTPPYPSAYGSVPPPAASATYHDPRYPPPHSAPGRSSSSPYPDPYTLPDMSRLSISAPSSSQSYNSSGSHYYGTRPNSSQYSSSRSSERR
jgi:hypothetical protein